MPHPVASCWVETCKAQHLPSNLSRQFRASPFIHGVAGVLISWYTCYQLQKWYVSSKLAINIRSWQLGQAFKKNVQSELLPSAIQGASCIAEHLKHVLNGCLTNHGIEIEACFPEILIKIASDIISTNSATHHQAKHLRRTCLIHSNQRDEEREKGISFLRVSSTEIRGAWTVSTKFVKTIGNVCTMKLNTITKQP